LARFKKEAASHWPPKIPFNVCFCAALAFLQLPFFGEARRVHHRFLIANEGLMLLLLLLLVRATL